jgi:hypothetical protein
VTAIFAKFKVSTHIASAISCDNLFVMLALNKNQDAIVNDMSPPKQMLESENFEPLTRSLMLKYKNHAKWEEAQ